MYDLVAAGELLIDFTPDGHNASNMQLFACNPGGSPANLLVMFSRLGGKTAFIGKVGNDPFGHFLKKTLVQHHVNTTGLVFDEINNTTLAFVHLDEKGDRSFRFYRKSGADIMLRKEEINRSLIRNCKIFHFSGVALTDEPCRSAILASAQFAKANQRIISLDPNYRPFLWHSQDAKGELLRALELANIVKVSEEEMTLLTGEHDLQKGAAMLSSFGPTLVLVSLGAKGAFYHSVSGHSGILPTYDVKTVDTTGAGDAFLAAILYCLRNKSVEDLVSVSDPELREIVAFANAAGSLTTMNKGAIPSLPAKESIQSLQSGGNLLSL